MVHRFYTRALEKEHIMKKYEEVTARLEQDLEGICFEKLDISDEVKEQIGTNGDGGWTALMEDRRQSGRNLDDWFSYEFMMI
ncbi:U-box domain-containing protein 12 [Artemisia annua]|uniref:U-box domain-containing protein 12 n=1 Tax=Artemisia annua TaxID=35608 RepID=A0A2U1M163_ARTAN|nr:U-box domain-containing protein 12 [Artemisia annua]